jgi:hypothetical protein
MCVTATPTMRLIEATTVSTSPAQKIRWSAQPSEPSFGVAGAMKKGRR